jgi:hypothetical protein
MLSFIENTRINERDFHSLELSLAVLEDIVVSTVLCRDVIVGDILK